MTNDNDPGTEILEAIRAAGRKVLPMHEYLAEHDPAGLAGFNSFLQSVIYDNVTSRFKSLAEFGVDRFARSRVTCPRLTRLTTPFHS